MDIKAFITKIDNIFNDIRKDRIKILGQDQNNEVEKRIFLQMLDFLWRSNLQYLEQLRQVIGLRSYGQKDPLAEFRKEAFELFENLLLKVKVDTIKFLMNLKVVVQEKKDDDERPKTPPL